MVFKKSFLLISALSFKSKSFDEKQKLAIKVANIINKIKPPFNTTAISQSIAIKALEDKEYIDDIVKLNLDIKSWFESQLNLLNINEDFMKFKISDIDLCKLKPNYNELMKEKTHAKY